MDGRLLCWQHHRQRLVDTFALYTAAVCGTGGSLSEAFLQRVVCAIRQACSQEGQPASSLRVVMVVYSTSEPVRCSCLHRLLL